MSAPPSMPEPAGGLMLDWPRGFGWMIPQMRPLVLSVDEKMDILAQSTVDHGDMLTQLIFEVAALKKRVAELERKNDSV